MQQADATDTRRDAGASSGKFRPITGHRNVFRLPTAAARKVHQRSSLAIRAARKAAPWPGDYLLPSQRDGQRFAQLTRSPELLVAMAMVSTMPPEQMERVKNIVHRVFWASGDESSRMASVLMAALGTEIRA